MRPSRTREERGQNNLYISEQDLVREHQKQAEEKRRMKQIQELQDKEEILNHYKNNIGGRNDTNDPEISEQLQKLQQEEDFLNQLKAKLQNQDPDFYNKVKEEQMLKLRKEKVEQYHKIHSENNDPNEFMFVKDPTSGQQLSKGEMERQKRLQLREQERQRRLLGQESSAYDQKNKGQPLSLPFQLEQQINGGNDEERRLKKLNDLFDAPSEPIAFNNQEDDRFRQTQSNFMNQNQNANFYNNQEDYGGDQIEIYPSQNQPQKQQQQINHQNSRKAFDSYEETDIFGNKKTKRVIKADQVNRPIENAQVESDNISNYQSPQQNNIYSQNTQKLQQNFSNNRRRSFHENQQEDGKLPSIQNNRQSNDFSNKQNQGGNSNIFGIGNNQIDSKKEKMLKYRQELDQQKELKNQIGYSIKPYSAQQERRGTYNGGSPQSGLPPPGPSNNNKEKDGFFDKFGQDPQFKKNLQNWEQQQFRNLQNVDQFKPYSAQASREVRNTPGRPPIDPNINNNNNDNFFDKFGQDQPSNRQQLRRPQSYQNLDDKQNMAKMSKEEYADFIMRDMIGKNNDRNKQNIGNNNSYQQINLNKSLNNIEDNRGYNQDNQYNRNDTYNNNNPYINQSQNQQPSQQQQQQYNQPAQGIFQTDEEEQKYRNKEKQRLLKKELEEQMQQNKKKKEEEKRKEKEYDQTFIGGQDKQNIQNQEGNRGSQQQYQQQQISNQPSRKSLDYDDLMNNNNQQLTYNPSEPNLYQQQLNDPYNQQQLNDNYSQQPQQQYQQQQQQQQQQGNFARNKVLHNETVDKEGQQKAMEAKKRYAEELIQQKLEAEKKKEQEKQRKKQEDLQEEMKMLKQIEEEKRKQEEEEQKKNRKKQEVDDFNKNKKVEQDVQVKNERVRAGRDLEQSTSQQQLNNNRKPNFHEMQKNNKQVDDFDQKNNNMLNNSNRLDLFENNQSIQQQNMDYLRQPNNNTSNLNNQFSNNYNDNLQQQPFYQQNQLPFPLQQNQMQNNPMLLQNMNMMNMMPYGNQFDQNMFNQQQIMMQQYQQYMMMQMMQMDNQQFNQMLLAPQPQNFLFNRNEFEIQRQIMEEKLRIHQFALQEQNLIDEYRQRLNKAREDKDEFERKIILMQNELETKYGEKFNMQLFSQIILEDSTRNKQSSLDSYHNLQQSVANFKRNAEILDQQIQRRQTNSNFYQNQSQRVQLNNDPFTKQSIQQLNFTKNQNTQGVNDSNHSLYNQIRKLEETPLSTIAPAQPFRSSQINKSNFEGALQWSTQFEHISGNDLEQSFLRDQKDYELLYRQGKDQQHHHHHQDQQIQSNSRLNTSQKNPVVYSDSIQNTKKGEHSNFLEVPEAIKNNANNNQIQQSFMQKTYQSQMMQSINPSVNINANNINLPINTSNNNPNQQNQQHQKSTLHQNSQALNINFNDPGSVIEELPREEMDDTSKNNDKSLSNNFQRQQSSSSQQQVTKPQQNKMKFHNLERQNLMKNASDFNDDDLKNSTVKREEEQEEEEQDQFYLSGYAQSEARRLRDNNSLMHHFQTNESQNQFQSQLLNLELKKTDKYYEVFQEHFPQEDGKDSRFSKFNNNDDDDDEEDDDKINNNNKNRGNKDKFNSQEDYGEIEEDEDGFENDGYEVNKYYNKEQIIEEEIEGTATDNNTFGDNLHFDSEQKKKLKQAIAEVNRNSNELGHFENQYKSNKDNSIITQNKDMSIQQGNQVNQSNKLQQNNQKEVSYQQIQQHLDESVNVPKKKDKGDDDGLGQTQISEIHSTLKETDMDKKIPTNVMKLLKQHTNILHNSQNLEENSPNKNTALTNNVSQKNNNSRMPAAPKNSNIMIQQNYEIKKSIQDVNWEMQQQQMIDEKSRKFQSQHWNQNLNMKKVSQNKVDDEIPEDIDITNQQEIEMKEAEYNNQEISLALPEDEIDKEQLGQFIESSSGYKNQTKLSDPEDQQTMQSEEFDNNEDFQRHLQLNMLKNLNNQMKEQHDIKVKNIKIRPYSANMPLITNIGSKQPNNANYNSNNNVNINNNNSNLTSYSTNNNNNNNNNNINNHQDKRSTGGFKKPKTIDVFGKITSPKNNIPTLEQSSSKNKGGNNNQNDDSYQSNPAPLFQYKGSSVSYEQSQFINNFNNNNNPQHKLISMTRMDEQTEIFNNLVNPSSVLQEEESYQFGKDSSQPSFLRHDITTSSNNINTFKNKPASSTQSLPKKSDMILNRLENLISNLENSAEQNQVKQSGENLDNRNAVFRSSFNKK